MCLNERRFLCNGTFGNYQILWLKWFTMTAVFMLFWLMKLYRFANLFHIWCQAQQNYSQISRSRDQVITCLTLLHLFVQMRWKNTCKSRLDVGSFLQSYFSNIFELMVISELTQYVWKDGSWCCSALKYLIKAAANDGRFDPIGHKNRETRLARLVRTQKTLCSSVLGTGECDLSARSICEFCAVKKFNPLWKR